MIPPGLEPRRLVRLMREAVERLRLDLRGTVVLTEGASGPYAATAILAALAGAAKVTAFTRATQYGSVEAIREETGALAALAGVRAIEVVSARCGSLWGDADIVTNSGHLRPLDREAIEAMRPEAVIPLMYESWEFREADVDLRAAAERGIPVAGTNERHPDIDVFSYLGIMAVKLMLDARIPVHGTSLLLLCDNPFAPYLERGLAAAGASVRRAGELPDDPGRPDALLVATSPGRTILAEAEAERLARAGAPVVLQYWGDVDRAALRRAGIECWPPREPAGGHMGVLPSEVGPEPIIRLQAGGLKVGEVLRRLRRDGVAVSELGRRLATTGYGEMLHPSG